MTDASAVAKTKALAKGLDPSAKLSFGERVAYGLGDYAGNLVYSSISAFLLVYYTDVAGIAAATAGSVMAISRIFDGVSGSPEISVEWVRQWAEDGVPCDLPSWARRWHGKIRALPAREPVDPLSVAAPFLKMGTQKQGVIYIHPVYSFLSAPSLPTDLLIQYGALCSILTDLEPRTFPNINSTRQSSRVSASTRTRPFYAI